MRKRRDIASLMRNVERPTERNTNVGVASSISGDGSIINGQVTVDGEVRDLLIALPYGISSSGVDGVRLQVIVNDNKNNVAVGVIDKNRPPIRSGCIAIYDKSGSSITLNGDGTITINCSAIKVTSGNIAFGNGMSVDSGGNITMNNNVTINGNVTMSGGANISGGASIDNANINSANISGATMSGMTEITGTAKYNGREIETK